MKLSSIQENRILRKLNQMAYEIPTKNATKVQDSVQSISKMLDDLGIKKYKINPQTLVVDVDGNVNLTEELKRFGIKEIPCQFGKVKGNFNCSNNQLTSLEGCPQTVGGHFNCYDNNLTSLEGAPSQVGGDFICYWNNLTSLEGAPSQVGGNFMCNNNKLISLKGAPNKVGGTFDCDKNRLTSLEGAPSQVGGNFTCCDNKTEFTEENVLDVSKVIGNIWYR
jgi:hypothetical protein